MASNSIRVSTEIFSAATDEGRLMSRSAAQQLEHWARLGRALEGAGLSVEDVKAVLEIEDAGGEFVPVDALWASKRQQQSVDLAAVASGRRSTQEMSWFSPEQARKARVIGQPF